jgi:RsiW-degrading membrane proteinase PrsW (M82 family)
MNIIIILIAALLPAILLWIYIWRKDPQKEPLSRLVIATILGVVICIPISVIELGIDAIMFGVDGEPTSLAGTTAMAFLSAALPEEAIKLLALWLVLRKNRYYDEHFDGIVYAVCIGLGFAAIENIVYVFSEEEWVAVAISRALLAVPGHYAFAILMGYYYSIYHFVDHSPKAAARVLLIPVLFHGVYDAIAMSGTVNPVLGGISFFVLVYFCIKMHKLAKTKIVEQIKRDRPERYQTF